MTHNRILILNAGSSSLKIGLFDLHCRTIAKCIIEGIGAPASRITLIIGARQRLSEEARLNFHARALDTGLQTLERFGEARSRVKLVGHRFVHGGPLVRPAVITARVERTLRTFTPFAPLHQPLSLATFTRARFVIPNVKHVAVFDTAFFARLPEVARIYALPGRISKRFHIRRYGFHGLSHAWALQESARMLGKPVQSVNLISMHLGAGASIAAIEAGKPIDTSMGVTPYEGLLMATRAGDLDPGIVLLLSQAGWSSAKLERLLAHESGWYGLTGFREFTDVLIGAGIRVAGRSVHSRLNAGQRRACRAAVDLFVFRAAKYIGAYQALLGRVDGIAFTGAIGARNAFVRKRILDRAKTARSFKALVVPSDEEQLIARSARTFIR